MSKREFIRTNRKKIDEHIRKILPHIGTINDDEREQWIMNDEGLYNWARAEGVKL